MTIGNKAGRQPTQGARSFTFREADHPRDELGQFTEAGLKSAIQRLEVGAASARLNSMERPRVESALRIAKQAASDRIPVTARIAAKRLLTASVSIYPGRMKDRAEMQKGLNALATHFHERRGPGITPVGKRIVK